MGARSVGWVGSAGPTAASLLVSPASRTWALSWEVGDRVPPGDLVFEGRPLHVGLGGVETVGLLGRLFRALPVLGGVLGS